MATPNLLSLTTITPATIQLALSTTNPTQVASNAAASGQVCKIVALYVSNTDGTNPYPISINYYSAGALGGTAYSIGSTINVPANSTLQVINKEGYIYLLEDTSLGVTAGTANKLVVNATWEVCS